MPVNQGALGKIASLPCCKCDSHVLYNVFMYKQRHLFKVLSHGLTQRSWTTSVPLYQGPVYHMENDCSTGTNSETTGVACVPKPQASSRCWNSSWCEFATSFVPMLLAEEEGRRPGRSAPSSWPVGGKRADINDGAGAFTFACVQTSLAKSWTVAGVKSGDEQDQSVLGLRFHEMLGGW